MMLVPTLIAAAAAFVFGTIMFPSPVDSIMEGYYPPAEICQCLGTTKPNRLRKRPANKQCPQWNIDNKWSKTSDYVVFVEKLTKIETLALEWDQHWQDSMSFPDPPIKVVRQRGLAPSRIEVDKMAGNSEYRIVPNNLYYDGKIEGWTDALLSLYVKEFNVKPSQEFLDFVNSFDLAAFEEELEMLKIKHLQKNDS